MESRMVALDTTYVVGMQYFGNPIATGEAWSAANQIGQLWGRFNKYMESNPDAPFRRHARDGGYEVHAWNDEMKETREHYVMVGVACDSIDEVPPELVVKVLPEGQYAVFTAKGEEITSDWEAPIYKEMLPKAGFEPSAAFLIEYYDERFKGLEGDALAQSELDIYVPVRPKSG